MVVGPSTSFRPEKKSTRVAFGARRLPGGEGGLPREGVGVETFSLGFEGGSWDVPGICRDVPDPWKCSKSLCPKSSCSFFSPSTC